MSDNLTTAIENPRILGTLCGPNDCNLQEISRLLSIPVHTRGNEIILTSRDQASRLLFSDMLDKLQEIAYSNENIDKQHIRSIYASLISDGEPDDFKDSVLFISPGSRKVYPRGKKQIEYVTTMKSKDLVFSVGPAGTGKTYLAIAHGLSELLSRKKRKMVLTRPVVETGESLGFLPGDLTQKLAPYLKPLYDAMEDLLDPGCLESLRSSGQLEVAPLAYMRGRSLKNCYIILDEAQNTTIGQMKMFLTRLGEDSQAVVTGDITQIDLPKGQQSGLQNAIEVLKTLSEVAVIRFTSADVVRHPLVQKIIDAYENLH